MESLWGFKLDRLGNLYCWGEFNSSFPLTTVNWGVNLQSVGSSDNYLVKLNSQGQVLWIEQHRSRPLSGIYMLMII